ncbi:M20/M25/M40 family metallo-hydrolase [Patescibacteria group bacterium]|nr:M20/M25/M40 family metallo-hydrolase [Patescibacteria group bacterium]
MKNIENLTKSLIEFPSTKENVQARKDIVLFVREQFKECDVFVDEFDYNDDPSIIITLKKEKNPFLFLNGHLDVVPACSENDFIPYVKDGKIYGRGSGDMKAACAVMIEAMKYFSKQKNRPSVGLMLTTDEESGGENGVGYLINNQKYSSTVALIPDGGINLNTVVLNEKGVIRLRIKSFGKAAHSARPFFGKNAIDELIQKYLKLRQFIPEIKQHEWKNSLNLSIISGGDIANKVPDYAEAIVDIRFIDKKERDLILQEIGKITKDTEIFMKSAPFVQDKNSIYIRQYQDILKQELANKEISFLNSEGSSDAMYFSENNIPTVITKINCDNIHSNDEWVDIGEMEVFYRVLMKFIK